MYAYESVLQSQTERVKSAYPRQILDPHHPAYGAFLSERSGQHPNADHTCNASDLASASFVLLAEGSELENNAELFDRIQKSIAFQCRWQRPTGLIDLVSVNWESPPDTGFTVQLLSPVVEVARRQAKLGNEQASEIAETLGQYVRTAAEGMIDRGFHTPNHRWVVCSGLAQAMVLFPDLPARDYVDRILEETIDINDDGEYTERSTGVYNADSFYDMAQRDGNGMWAQVADGLAREGTDQAHSPWLLQPYMQNPGYRQDTLGRDPLPNNYARHYPISGLWRVKRNKLSDTAATSNRAVFAVRYGDINLRSADTMAPISDGIQMQHIGANHPTPGYDLPLNTEVPLGQFGQMRKTRERWTCPEIDLNLNIVEVENGFDLRYNTEGGLDRVPIEIECTFEGPGEWETANNVMHVDNGQTAILKSGYGTFHNGLEGISIGPGSAVHRDWAMRNSEPDENSFRVLITLQTPVDHTLEIRCGIWSIATHNLLSE